MVNQMFPPLYIAESILCLACAEVKQTYSLVMLCSHHLSAGQMRAQRQYVQLTVQFRSKRPDFGMSPSKEGQLSLSDA